jgi:serine/alanine adding enzyme
MQVVRHLDERPWSDFVAQTTLGNIFHTPEMFQVFARTKGHRPTLWATVNGAGVPLALFLPVQVTLIDNLPRQLTTRAVVYGSVVCMPGTEGQEALTLLLRTYNHTMKRHLLFTELRNLSDLSNLQPVLNAQGCTYEGHLNYLIDLDQPEESIWRNISKSGRQGVRTSRNKGTVIEEVTERHKITIAYQLLQTVYQRAQVPLASFSLFEAAFDILAPRGMFKIFVARAEEHYLSVCLLLLYNGRIIYWYAGADRAFASYSSNELLIWHVLQWGRANGFHLFDFGGAGRPDEPYGPREFKAKFGGELVNYGRNTCVHAPQMLRLSKMGYDLYRRYLMRQAQVG